MSEIALFRAVVLRALSDATKSDGGSRDAIRERSHARDWLLGGSRDFREVCRFAELDPDYIREKAKALAAVASIHKDRRNPDGDDPWFCAFGDRTE
jgi:hypothetical protein